MKGAVKPAPKRGSWRAVDPEMGELVFVCPACWPDVAAGWRAWADVTVRELVARPSVGALRRVRSGGRVLMRAVVGGVRAATVRTGTGPAGGERWRDGAAGAA